MKFAYPGRSVVFLVLGITIIGANVYLTVQQARSVPPGYPIPDKVIVGLFGSGVMLLVWLWAFYRTLAEGFFLRFWQGSCRFQVAVIPGQTVAIGPFHNLEGSALVVDVYIDHRGLTPPVKSFRIYTSLPSAKVCYHLALFGVERGAESLIAEDTANRQVTARSSSQDDEDTGAWREVVFPIDRSFEAYELRLRSDLLDTGRGPSTEAASIAGPRSLRLTVHCAIGASPAGLRRATASSLSNATARIS